MKRIAVREFGGPEVLTLEETQDPRPGRGEVVVRVMAEGVNPFDTYMRSSIDGARNPALPFTPGSDAAGVVHATARTSPTSMWAIESIHAARIPALMPVVRRILGHLERRGVEARAGPWAGAPAAPG